MGKRDEIAARLARLIEALGAKPRLSPRNGSRERPFLQSTRPRRVVRHQIINQTCRRGTIVVLGLYR